MRWVAFALAVAFAALVACGSNPRNLLVVPYDAGSDAAGDAAADAPFDAPADADPYLGGPCVDDAQCDDMIACTYDSCDQALGRCLNVPDDTQCQDGIYCDGREKCVPRHGCEPGPVVTCSDGNACDISSCVEKTQSCAHVPRDVDQDGDPDAHCVAHRDCDDLNPNVSSLHAEVCHNGVDDNCNGLIDEMPCVVPQGDTCADAVAVSGAGTYALSTVGCNDTFATSCSVSKPSAGQNVVAAIAVPPGPNVDLEVWATTSDGTEIAVAIQGTCGQATSELACGSGPGATSVRARTRNVAPGTYYAVVTTQSPTAFELKVDLLTPPTAPATNVDCASAAPLTPGTPTTVSLIDPPTDLPSACPASTGELTYSFTLTQPQDVRIYASTVQGSGQPIVGLRDPACTAAADEIGCRVAGAPPIYERALPAGTYVVTVAATSPVDVTLEVDLSPPTTAPADQTCAAPPAATTNGRIAFDLSDHEDAIKDGCDPGAPDAAYDVSLPAASDVLLVSRLAQSDSGAVALDAPACDASSVLACVAGTTPIRAGKRNVPAGDYRAVVTDVLGLQGTLDVLVRPTVAPTILPSGGADTCAAAVDASAGGFFTGDTSTTTGHYPSPCDAPTGPSGGENDQVLSLTLAQPQRVVLDMEGSAYQTILDVRQGPSCPGTPVTDGCYVGFDAERSFLDLELPAGQYWVLVEGYEGAKGAWDLDVRVLPP